MREQNQWRKLGLSLLVTAGFLWGMPTFCQAEVVQGQAVIDPSNPGKARSDAMQDAMRSYVESKVGVQVHSETEVNMGMVVRDEIVTHADGYVQVKKVIKEEKAGGIYFITLDLEANDQKITTAVQDLKSRLQALEGMNTSRSGVEIAITGRDENGKLLPADSLMKYMQTKLQAAGFQVFDADEVKAYMDSQTDLDQPAVSAKIRQIARNNREEANSLLRGTLSVTDVHAVNRLYQATVHASFELIGLDSSSVDSFDDYYTAVKADRQQAIRAAQDIAVQKAVENLGQKALETVQSETRGGISHRKLTLVINGITNRNNQGALIRQALQQTNCRIIRSSFTSAGALKIFVEADGYGTTDELSQAILAKVQGLQPGNVDESAMGSEKLYFTF